MARYENALPSLNVVLDQVYLFSWPESKAGMTKYVLQLLFPIFWPSSTKPWNTTTRYPLIPGAGSMKHLVLSSEASSKFHPEKSIKMAALDWLRYS